VKEKTGGGQELSPSLHLYFSGYERLSEYLSSSTVVSSSFTGALFVHVTFALVEGS
jgi:hypothetical protein